jgi:hypothetical protein
MLVGGVLEVVGTAREAVTKEAGRQRRRGAEHEAFKGGAKAEAKRSDEGVLFSVLD